MARTRCCNLESKSGHENWSEHYPQGHYNYCPKFKAPPPKDGYGVFVYAHWDNVNNRVIEYPDRGYVVREISGAVPYGRMTPVRVFKSKIAAEKLADKLTFGDSNRDCGRCAHSKGRTMRTSSRDTLQRRKEKHQAWMKRFADEARSQGANPEHINWGKANRAYRSGENAEHTARTMYRNANRDFLGFGKKSKPHTSRPRPSWSRRRTSRLALSKRRIHRATSERLRHWLREAQAAKKSGEIGFSKNIRSLKAELKKRRRRTSSAPSSKLRSQIRS